MKPKPAPVQVLDFWFGTPGEREYGHPRAAWFQKNRDFDEEIRTRFLATWEAGDRGELDEWREQPASAVALCVVLDQFPRNLFRGDARAFSTDAAALACAEYALTHAFDKRVLPVQRMFLYLPLEHHEDLATQQRCVALFERLAQSNPELAEAAEYARRHRDIIARFGRFPHRNAVLGRTSTPEEIAFLRQPGSSF